SRLSAGDVDVEGSGGGGESRDSAGLEKRPPAALALSSGELAAPLHHGDLLMDVCAGPCGGVSPFESVTDTPPARQRVRRSATRNAPIPNAVSTTGSAGAGRVPASGGRTQQFM